MENDFVTSDNNGQAHIYKNRYEAMKEHLKTQVETIVQLRADNKTLRELLNSDKNPDECDATTAQQISEPPAPNNSTILKDWKEELEKLSLGFDIYNVPTELAGEETNYFLAGFNKGLQKTSTKAESFFLPIIQRLQENVDYFKRERDYHKEKQIEAEVETEDIRKEINRLQGKE